VDEIYQHHGQGYRHDYFQQYQILDVDLTGLPCGKKAALATKGYFAGARNRRGRQLGRVLATHYGEVVADRLFEGRTSLAGAFQPPIQVAEQTLRLDIAKRSRTLLRVDAGGGKSRRCQLGTFERLSGPLQGLLGTTCLSPGGIRYHLDRGS